MASRNLETFRALTSRVKGDPTSTESVQALVDAVTSDMEHVQPPSLPQGGIHKGADGWRKMAAIMGEHWEIDFQVTETWDLPEDDVVILYLDMEWTARATGRTAHFPALELLRFRDGKISKAEIFFQDTKVILDTLEPA